jgi:hypothetical protein
MNDALAQISARYSKFAEDEAHGKSPLYEELAGRIAADPAILAYPFVRAPAKDRSSPISAVRCSRRDGPPFRSISTPSAARSLLDAVIPRDTSP